MMSYEWRNRKLPAPTFMERNAPYFYLLLAGLCAVALLLFYRNRMLNRLARSEQASRRQLEEHVRFIEALGESLPHPIVVRDKGGKVILCNSKYLAILNAPIERVLGTSFAEGLKGLLATEAITTLDDVSLPKNVIFKAGLIALGELEASKRADIIARVIAESGR